MNTQDELVDIQLVEKIKKVYENSHILIISSNKSMRLTLKKVFSTLGFSTSNIMIAENFSLAKEIFESHCPEIVISSLFIDNKSVEDLVALHSKLIPNRLKSLFFVVTELNKKYLNNLEQDLELDGVLTGEQNFITCLNLFSKKLNEKLPLSKKEILLAKINETLKLREPEKAKAFLEATREIEIDDYHLNKIQAKIALLNNQDEKALEHLQKMCQINNTDYFAILKIIEICFNQRKFDIAYEYTTHFLKHYTSSPSTLPIILKVYLFNKEFQKIVDLCEQYLEDDLVDASTKTNIAASLALAGKSLVKENPAVATHALSNALHISAGKSFNILQMVIYGMLEQDENLEQAVKFIEKYKHNYLNQKQFQALEFEVISKTLDSNQIYIEGSELIKKDIKSTKIYSSLIQASLVLGRRKDIIEDLVFEACREFPDFCDQFKSHLA